MSRLLQVAQLGNEVLREKAKTIKKIDKNVKDLAADLIASLMEVDGVGIAAPQVYESKRLFIVASHPNPRYPNAPEMDPTPVINPKITSHSKEKIKDYEGCLSIPGIRALVPRWKWVKVEYTDLKGKKVKTKFEDFIARIFQHELDHLDGLVFLDRVEDNKEIIADKEYQKIIKAKK